MKGIELAARFSYITNSLEYCGPKEASRQIEEYILKKDNEKYLRKSLSRFEGMYPYLKAIADKNGKDPFDYDVVEAYWIGNSLLDSFNDADIKKLILSLIQRGLPKSIGNKLTEELPSGFKPHHSFNVFYVGVGRITGSVETTLKNMNKCRINYGKVVNFKMSETSIRNLPASARSKKAVSEHAQEHAPCYSTSVLDKNKILIKTKNIIKKNDKYSFSKDELRTISFIPKLIKNIKKNDFVAVHWDFALVKLTSKQIKNIDKYTEETLKIMNGLL